MNIYRFEFKNNFKATVGWIVGICSVALMYLSFFQVTAENAEAMKDLFKSFPPAILAALDVIIDRIFSFTGYYAFVFTFTVLIGAIQAINLGINLYSKEKSKGVGEFLFVKPISRVKIYLSKFLAGFSLIVLTNIVYMVFTVVCEKIFNNGLAVNKAYYLISFTLFFIQLVFMSIGILVGVFKKKIKSSISIALVLSFLFYGINMINNNLNDKFLRILSPMQYFDYMYIQDKESYEVSSLVYTIILIGIFIAISYLGYKKAEIRG